MNESKAVKPNKFQALKDKIEASRLQRAQEQQQPPQRPGFLGSFLGGFKAKSPRHFVAGQKEVPSMFGEGPMQTQFFGPSNLGSKGKAKRKPKTPSMSSGFPDMF